VSKGRGTLQTQVIDVFLGGLGGGLLHVGRLVFAQSVVRVEVGLDAVVVAAAERAVQQRALLVDAVAVLLEVLFGRKAPRAALVRTGKGAAIFVANTARHHARTDHRC